MGKPTSCFKLIACGGDAAEKDDYHVSEVNDSNDKRGWSFSKKSARHRVLNNTVIAEAPSSANKESSECTNFNFQPLPEPNVVEKIYTTNFSDEKPQLSSFESSQLSETKVNVTESKVDVNPSESAVIIIQTAIRGLMAQRELLRLKNVVKLQAAVRGHLVRRHAVGTLRCVQAIAKMQVLVRARRARQSCLENHLNQKDGKNDSSKALGNEDRMTKPNATYTSIEKLLSNKFAHQLLESTPKNKPIHVKCDPSKADSAWKWLERWMSVSSKDIAECRKTNSLTVQSDKSKDSTFMFQFETGIPSEVFLQSAESKPIVGDSIVPSEDEEKMITYDASNFKFQADFPTSSIVKDDLEKIPSEETIACDSKAASAETDSFQNEKSASDASAPSDLNSLHQKPDIDGDQRAQSMKRLASDQLEAEGKKSVNGSRKVSNPAFIAAHSKFEELSSMANSGRTSNWSYQDAAVESQVDSSSVGTDTAYRTKELIPENPSPYLSRVGGSECGTELSVSSTLDSPDISDVGATENERDAKDLVEGIGNLENTITHDDEANVPCSIPASNLATSVLDQSETVDDITDNMVHSVLAVDSEVPAIKTETDASDPQREQAKAVAQDFKSSPEASPRSHITVPESQGTPSSQVSMKPKKSKIDKSGSSNKRVTNPATISNKSPANASYDSGSRGDREQLPKDQRSGKRRNSFGSVKLDHIDQEPRDNSSINSSIPHFMQATQSAKAKINANNSPRSSPDVHEQDNQVKKRHSLPGATGRQVSPRIQQSSQAQQSATGNSIHPPQEKKWVR